MMAGPTEWAAFPDHPDLGHRPDPHRPTHTRCGRPLDTAEPVHRPHYGHTDCLPRATETPDVAEPSLWDPDEEEGGDDG